MARLKNVRSGAVVNVPDEKAERLGSEWAPYDDESQKAHAARGTKTQSKK